ncbi:hypothetical protein PHYBLDRAFT_174501 [Phycomyces blakesleeanus NRRL 1555(-)]|uniref:MULE transposase domain-containing protein n=1 Tax=Phycomyces blakesleeanus (strain ATCC 8743b / DSM 1359 / FGSC 10004 / NBRC 33097 / NRRL 1555) TaxID=763407 RepID=A0A167K2B1_PHYB8|nr:hypothetical protein PHYBLDRAFT_174501 [Phycomyces blakesleeanus NRRL 1555(-)]OAD67117.1 hypothetical protein PHYBLDRAFT_174501 [Phycomyces blakesleeanus NRRL 1555(-)]|eukprot:XP_018285157.1 hypothetical protein PHYBLDRAFT_174501 [Phycomyces blakesleeanus NRRL 1555(-)]
MTRDHNNHVPGDRSEMRTLPLPFEAIKLIEDQLRSGSSCRSTRISVLRQIDSWGVSVRKPNYEEIYNRMKKMNEKLPERNYCVFTGDLRVNNIESNLFAFGFQLPAQVRVMRIATSFCLDATHGISARSGEVMYSLVTQHNVTGKGFPVAYMVTNDQTVRSISQWLMHLHERSYFCPLNITIDCSIPKVNAITSAFPHVAIHYCEFHILCAWQTNLDNKVRLDVSFTSAQLEAYKQELKNKQKYILIELNKEVFLTRILDFKRDIPNQLHFLRYFEARWTGSKVLLKRWGRPYVDDLHRRYLTNNYIESWHNQLKTIYFGCARIRRLDCLVFVLTNDVEYFYKQEVDHIHLNNKKMGPVENELARNEFAASKIDDDILSSMIISPLNVISTSMDDSDGEDANHLAMQRPAVLAEEEEVVIVDKEDGREDAVGAQNDVDTSITDLITHTTLLHHQRLNLKHMQTISDIDVSEINDMTRCVKELLDIIDNIRNRNRNSFRNMNTQRQ